jgi:hypothetical protein
VTAPIQQGVTGIQLHQISAAARLDSSYGLAQRLRTPEGGPLVECPAAAPATACKYISPVRSQAAAKFKQPQFFSY